MQRVAVANRVDGDCQMLSRDGVVGYGKLTSYSNALEHCSHTKSIVGHLPSATVRPNRYVFAGRSHSRRPGNRN